ncbi:hypothetical protein PV04_07462 [Phialophora macrospora]|uniref:Uncharacterized protein n=1 Tax=Phialophora macrospora TaxID=1851006 RepID=A0A0D2CIV0_9EURO|nr:hypothetical protein PV04_07462 [Phialophora macrospora]
MDSQISSTRRQRVRKPSSSPGSTASIPPFSTTIQSRFLAYELGSISRLKIEKEASKASPRLNKLVGHAAIFDSATRYIINYTDDADDVLDLPDSPDSLALEEIEDEEELGCGDIVYLEFHDNNEVGTSQSSFETANHAPFGHAHLEAKEECGIDVTGSLSDEDDNAFGDIEDESSSDSGDDYDCFDPEISGDSLFDGDWRRLHSDWDFWESSSKQIVSSAVVHDPQDDDLLLWSQQPRVLNEKQAESLFVEAFG